MSRKKQGVVLQLTDRAEIASIAVALRHLIRGERCTGNTASYARSALKKLQLARGQVGGIRKERRRKMSKTGLEPLRDLLKTGKMIKCRFCDATLPIEKLGESAELVNGRMRGWQWGTSGYICPHCVPGWEAEMERRWEARQKRKRRAGVRASSGKQTAEVKERKD